VPVHAEPLSAAALFERLRLQLGPLAFDRGLTLRFRGAHHALHADPALLGRILSNLVANALQHTDDGGVLVACRRVERSRLGRPQWRLQVWDSGCGIAAEALPRLFEPFYRAPTRRRVAGLGLGLSIALRLAEAMDARLSVRSMPGHGTVVTLTWPLP
jgi:two-component system, sensor histidine kinase